MTTVASLCMGIGGLDLAAETVYQGSELIWCSEYDAAPASVIQRHWPGVPNLHDLTLIDWAECEPPDVLTAGYPCQPFSQAGKRKGSDDERHLWPFIAEAVRVLRPRRVMLENVAGHLSLGFGDVLRDLAEAGFDAEWCVLRASDVGACHRRSRLFAVAYPPDSDCVAGAQTQSWGGRPGPVAEQGTVAGTFGLRSGLALDVSTIADTDVLGREGRESEPSRDNSGNDQGSPGCIAVVADPNGDATRRQPRTVPGTQGQSWDQTEGHGPGDGGWTPEQWGPFWPAVERWATVFGRRPPPDQTIVDD